MAVSKKRENPKAPAKTTRKSASAVGARLKAAPKIRKPVKKLPGRVGKQKHAGGRPPKYTAPATMAEKIAAYFESLRGEGDKPDRPPTMAGLALALGFLDRQSLRDYSARSEEYSCLVKKARLRIEAHHEERLSGANCTGSICWMNNHAGYTTTTELKHTGSVTILAHPLDEAL